MLDVRPKPMTSPKIRPSSLCLAASLALSVGCSSARMQLDPQLVAKAPEQPVKGVALATFRKPVTFGAYTAKLTRGGFQKGSKTTIGPYERESKSQEFEFTLAGGGQASWSGSCAFGTSKQGVLFPISNDAGFVCTLSPPSGSGWQLELASQGKLYAPNSLSGAMTDGTTKLSIAMVHKIAGSAFTSSKPVGYEFRDESGAAVAAVQILNPHLVWIDPQLPAGVQAAIAAATVGLLVSKEAASDINE